MSEMPDIEKKVAKFRAGLEPAETNAKIVQWTIFPTRLDDSGHLHQEYQVLEKINTWYFYSITRNNKDKGDR